MDQLDALFKTLAPARQSEATMIVCIHKGASPPTASQPMPREPSPSIGMPLDTRFAGVVREAVAHNVAIHDGAIMVGPPDANGVHRVTGWSYRLFPAGIPSESGVNHGSAFHSCLAMSGEVDVEATYLITAGHAYRFRDGQVERLV